MTLKLSTIIDLWEAFGDIPMDEDERIEEPFMGFDVGTDKMTIWHWFDRFIPVYELVYDMQTLREAESRVDLLERMHEIIKSLNDEEAYFDHWIYIVPDEPTHEDFESIAKNDDDMHEVEKLFCKLISKYGRESGFCD